MKLEFAFSIFDTRRGKYFYDKKNTCATESGVREKKRVFPARSGKDKASPSDFAARQVGWKIELALLIEHYAGIRGSARQKRGEKARERERQRERETERA